MNRTSKDKVLCFIKEFMMKNQYPPTVREIADGVGLKSPATTKYYLEMLEDDGVISYKEGSPRTIRIPGIEYREV